MSAEFQQAAPGRSASIKGATPTAPVLLVDDDPAIVTLLQEWLTMAGYSVVSATKGADALRLFFEQRPVLSVVDLRMKGMDGFQLIARIRELSDAPILVLSALGGEEQVVRGLDLGADEYVVKPISRGAFLARVRSLLRRIPTSPESQTTYADKALTLDLPGHTVTAYGQPIDLRPLEFRLLAYLVFHQDRMVSHQHLLDEVWGPDAGSLDSLKWYVSSLRRKIEQNPQQPRLIVNLRSLGYRYVPPQG